MHIYSLSVSLLCHYHFIFTTIFIIIIIIIITIFIIIIIIIIIISITGFLLSRELKSDLGLPLSRTYTRYRNSKIPRRAPISSQKSNLIFEKR